MSRSCCGASALVRRHEPRACVGGSRFLQTDPIPGGSANNYDYCNADPINCTDLDGRWPHFHKPKWLKKAMHVALVAATVTAMFTCAVCDVVGYGLMAYSAYRTYKDVRSRDYGAAAWDSLGVLGGLGEAGAAAREGRAVRELRATREYRGSRSVLEGAQSSWRHSIHRLHRQVNYWHSGNVGMSVHDLLF